MAHFKMKKKYLGLDKIRKDQPFEQYLGATFIKEGRDTFEALVPDRFKINKNDKVTKTNRGQK